MPNNRENQHVEATPHFDGEKESILNDATASAGSTVGIQLDTEKEFGHDRNPFNHIPKVEQGMQEFQKLMKDKKVEE